MCVCVFRVCCMQVQISVLFRCQSATAAATTRVWTASWPGTRTVPGTSPPSAAPRSTAYPPPQSLPCRVWRREMSHAVLSQVCPPPVCRLHASPWRCSGWAHVPAVVFIRMHRDKPCVRVLDPVAAVDFPLVPQNNIQLSCHLHSNLAQVVWRFSDRTLHSNHRYYIYSGGLLILSASESDAGLYTCESVEQINGRTHNRTVAVYRLQLCSEPGVGVSTTPGTEVTNSSDSSPPPVSTAAPGPEDPVSPETHSDTGRVTRLEVAVGLLSLFCLCLMGVIYCIWSGGRWACFRFAPVLQSPGESEGKRQSPCEYMHIQNRTLLGPESSRPCTANNNHPAVDFKGNGEHHFTPMANISSLDGLGYINDESEIWLCWVIGFSRGPMPVH